MSWPRRIWNALRPGRLDRDLERELRFHLAERADELQEAGLDRQQAERRAREQFGNWAHQLERTRDMDIQEWAASLLRNLRYAARSLSKTPGFSATVILTLALGIGANSAVFSAIYAVLLRPLPFPEGDRLVRLAQSQPQSPDPFVAPVRLEDWNRLNRTLLGVTGYYSEDASESSGELPERIRRAWVAPRFLEVLGISPALGRNFTPLEERFGGPPAVLISDRLWRRRFGADPHAVGRTLRFGRSGPMIVGILPASFQYPDRDVDIWAPSPPDAPYAQSRENAWFNTIGRLKPGITLPQARSRRPAPTSRMTARAICTPFTPLR